MITTRFELNTGWLGLAARSTGGSWRSSLA